MKTKIHIAISLAVAILSSCQLLRKDRLTLKKLNQQEELQVAEQRNILSQQRELVIIDSSHQDFTMMLWPKGHFKFSVTDGFEGEAEKIVIVGKQTNQRALKLKNEVKKDSTLVTVNYSNQQENSTASKTNKNSFGFSWWWLLVIPLLYVGYRVFRTIS